MLTGFQSEMDTPTGSLLVHLLVFLFIVPAVLLWWFGRQGQWLWAFVGAGTSALGVLVVLGVQLERDAKRAFDRVWRQRLEQFMDDEGLTKSDLLAIARDCVRKSSRALARLGEL